MNPLQPDLPNVTGARVLIVEDESIIAKDIELSLKSLGYQVCGIADTGLGAIEKAEETRPDVALMDIRLRGDMDGIDAARRIHQRLSIPIVFLTAYADEATLARAQLATPFGYILKPFDERDLHVSLVMAMCRHKAYAEVEERVRERTQELARSEERFRLLVNSVKDYAIVMLDPEGHITSWNAGAASMTGHASEEILGQPLSSFYPKEERQRGQPAKGLEEAAREGRFEQQGWRQRKDGSTFWAHLILTAVRDEQGQLRGFAAVTRDLTEQKRAEEERADLRAREQEARLRADLERARLYSVVMNIPASISIVRGPHHVYELSNPTNKHLLGRDPVGQRLVDLLPTSRERGLVQLMDRAYEQGETIAKTEFAIQVPLPEGGQEERFVNFVCQPLRGPDGQPEAVFTFTVDVTDEVRTRRKLEDLARERERLVAELREAIRVRDEFLSIAAHELKTPLTAMELQLSLLDRTATGVLQGTASAAEKLVTKIQQIARQVERLTGLTANLLDVSRAVAGRLMIAPEDTDFGSVIEDVLDKFLEQAERADCELRVDLEPGCVGHWDRLRLDQIVTNLLSNAIKYGAGTPVELRLRSQGDSAMLTVKDFGIGIAIEDQTRVFERFERAVSSRHFGGLGLGLWIVRQVVTAMGGAITVKSEPGSGSEFTVVLPKMPPVQPQAAAGGQAS
ncbi:hybrid sensor histidine kinase/response regulator [Hyalangium gracile]|uniref:hybrid sensor histidine kinase/response regulator n=1 Tax=Hyalangium gracile TaxID=394092 RepID=UPI001CCBC7F4|nr:PAS domain S-box protein [Hyalangium gracile]